MEWLGARVYDPASRGFLSTDPLEPTTGAGWSGNPYSYAGNDPMHALDPTGLHPVTDAELQAYRDSNGIGGTLSSAWNATKSWMKNNWEYVAGGAMVLAGGVLIATGVGGPVGMMLVSAGADTIIQKATTGEVNWGEVAVSGALGGIGGAGIAARAGLTGIKATIVAGAASGAIGGAGTSAYTYTTGPGPHSVGGFLTATGEGAAAGAVIGGAGGAAGHGISSVLSRGGDVAAGASSHVGSGVADSGVGTAARTLDDVAPTPATPSPIDPDTAKLADHVAQAKADFDNGLIPPASAKEAANLSNPRVAAATRGTMIDRQAKGYIDADPDLAHLYTTPAGHYGPDIIDPSGSGRWWDITTQGQWQNHLDKYGHMGPGIGIFTN